VISIPNYYYNDGLNYLLLTKVQIKKFSVSDDGKCWFV